MDIKNMSDYFKANCTFGNKNDSIKRVIDTGYGVSVFALVNLEKL